MNMETLQNFEKPEKEFVPRFEQLSHEESEHLLMALTSEHTAPDHPGLPEKDWPIPLAIIMKRVSVLGLPIRFTPHAQFALLVWGTNPGRAVVTLIDCLNRFEGKTVTAEMLCDLYPLGKYTEEALTDYIDNYMKPRKVKWSEVYGSRR